jgi:hypothetical protein
MHLKERVKQIEQVKGFRGAKRYVWNVAQALAPAVSPQYAAGHRPSSSLGKFVVKLKVKIFPHNVLPAAWFHFVLPNVIKVSLLCHDEEQPKHDLC